MLHSFIFLGFQQFKESIFSNFCCCVIFFFSHLKQSFILKCTLLEMKFPRTFFITPLSIIIFILLLALDFNLASLFRADKIFSLLVSLSSIVATVTFSAFQFYNISIRNFPHELFQIDYYFRKKTTFVTSTKLDESCMRDTSPESPPMQIRNPSG